MDTCIFCKLVRKDFSSEVIYEDDTALAVLDIHPIAPGHTMVLPKTHVENILNLPDVSIGPLFIVVKRVTELLNEAFHPDGFTIGINHGKWAGQAVDHLHIHVVPRWKNDGGKSIHSVVTNPPKESLTDIRKRIIN